MGVNLFVKSIIYRAAKLEDPVSALEAILFGQFDIITKDNGRILTSASGTDKSFTFQVASGMGPKELMAAVQEALDIFNTCTTAEIASFLNRRHNSWARTSFV